MYLQGTLGKISDEIRKKSVEVIRELGPVCIGSATIIKHFGLTGAR